MGRPGFEPGTLRVAHQEQGRHLPEARGRSRLSCLRPGEVSFAPPPRLSGMRGVITGKDVLRHSVIICRLWGPRCYLRCLRAALSSTPSTFLQVVSA